MNTSLSNENFGLVIAYILPGFVALWGVSYFSPTVESWITASQQGAPSVAGFMYVTVASLAAGLTVSGVRWAIIDNIHHLTGVVPPAWKFVNLDDKLQGFLTLNESHYRYYQFYAEYVHRGRRSRIRLGWFGMGRGCGLPAGPTCTSLSWKSSCSSNSRDTLAKYYSRVAQLLGTLTNPKERSVSYV